MRYDSPLDAVGDTPLVRLPRLSPGESVRIWACAATRDGFVSPPGGPWRAGAGAP